MGGYARLQRQGELIDFTVIIDTLGSVGSGVWDRQKLRRRDYHRSMPRRPPWAMFVTGNHECFADTAADLACQYKLSTDEGYAMEELVAELGSAFLSADLDLAIEPREDHAAYIGSWLKKWRARHLSSNQQQFIM